MIQGKTVLGIIPARGGSKGVPRKNIREAGGKPLIAWTIEEAKKSRYIDRLILSSEDEEIMETAKKFECEVPFTRPLEISGDDVSAAVVALHAAKTLKGYDYVVLLQPTSPFRTAEDIDACVERCVNSHAKASISVTRPDKSPYWMFTIDENNFLHPILDAKYMKIQRQKLLETFSPNGAIFVAETSSFLECKSFITDKTVAYEMSKEKSLDIDTKLDFMILNLMLKNRIK